MSEWLGMVVLRLLRFETFVRVMGVSQEAFFDNADSLVSCLRFIRLAYNAINRTQNSISRSRSLYT